ncbi:hypothetical protein CEXT_502541 [Caerostris extrusa]|uniref:Maturase K n=1 Tax=Caerostris extrusa TaxID=172846 RepID=A0AAV4XNH4_CAEEX|nr:hypothetical protein CEXT_502541 [Caerostris extrusa]
MYNQCSPAERLSRSQKPRQGTLDSFLRALQWLTCKFGCGGERSFADLVRSSLEISPYAILQWPLYSSLRLLPEWSENKGLWRGHPRPEGRAHPPGPLLRGAARRLLPLPLDTEGGRLPALPRLAPTDLICSDNSNRMSVWRGARRKQIFVIKSNYELIRLLFEGMKPSFKLQLFILDFSLHLQEI